jgi:hypothetical protein
MSRPRWALATAALLVTVGVAGCSRSATPAAGRLVVDGQADVARPGEDRREVTGTRDLTAGDRVRVRDGTAVIRLPGDRRIELRAGSDVELQSLAGKAEVRPTLLGGDLLAVSGAAPFDIALTAADVAVQGDARISRGVALLVASYKGTAQLNFGGASLTVPALRQAALPATGQFPTRVTPIEPSPADTWDQRYLSGVIELSSQLAARSEGFTAQLAGTDGHTLNYFRDLVPRLAAEPAFTAALFSPTRPPGETLVGAAITLEGKHGTFADRWANVFRFRDEGAPWGLVAMDQEVSRVPVLEIVDGAIGRGPTLFAAGPAVGPPSSLARPNGGSATTAVPPPTTTTVKPRPGATTTTTAKPAQPATTTTTRGLLDLGVPPVDDAVNALVNTLTGLLRSLGGQ